MARGTVLAEILLEGDRTFRRAVESSGDQMDDTAGDATGLSGALGLVGGRLDAVRDDALGLASSLQILQGRADEAGDELSQAGRRASITGGLFSALALSTDGVAFSFGSLSAVTTVSLIPSLLALSSILAPLIATVGALAAGAVGLATAFGAVIGSGIIAFGQQRAKQNQKRIDQINEQISRLEYLQETEDGLTLAQRRFLRSLKQEKSELEDATTVTGALGAAMADLKNELTPLIAEFGAAFVPLIEDAIDAIPTLVRNIFEAIGGVDEFATFLRELGAAAMDAIPAMVGTLVDLGRVALPVVEEFIGFLDANGGDIFNGMMESARAIMPSLRDLLDAVIEFIPAFTDFGITVTNQVLPALTGLFRHGTNALEFINALDPQLQALTASGLVLAPVITKIGMALAGLTGPIGLLVAGIGALAVAWQTNFGNIRRIVGQFGQDIQQVLGNRLPTLISELKQLFRTLAPIVEPIFSTLLKIASEFVTRGLDVILSTLTALVQLLNGDVSGAIETMGRLMIRVGNSVLEVVTMVAEGIVNAVIAAVNKLSRVINDRLVKSLPKDVRKAVGEDPFVKNIDPVDFRAPQVSGGRAPSVSAESRQRDRRVVLELKGDTEMFRAVAKDEATSVVKNESRTAKRQGGNTRGA